MSATTSRAGATPSSRSRPAPGPTTRPAPPAASRSSAGSPRGRASPARSAAARAAASASSARPADAEEALRGLDSLATGSGRGSPTGQLRLPRSAAPAGPGLRARQPATSSRSSRCAGWSPAATRSSKSPAGRRGAGLATTWQTLLNSVTFGHNVALGALRPRPGGAGRAALAAADRRPRQRRPRDPGAADRDPGRAGRRPLPPRRA